jgi:DNA repair protein RecO (recombination protein O)
VLGFEPSLDRCVFSREELLPAIREQELRELHFVHDPGGFALPGARAASDSALQPVPVERYLLLRTLAHDSEPVPIPGNSPEEVSALCDLLQEYCSRHLERMPHRKHLDIVSRLISA